MGQQNHHEYYVARAQTARSMAQRAVDPGIASIHAEMADRYEELARQSGPAGDHKLRIVQAA